jgi:hypothetical protein
MDFYGSNNYGAQSTGSTARVWGGMGYGGFASGDRGWVGPSGMLIYADYGFTVGSGNGISF